MALLELHNIGKNFGGLRALHDISLTLNRGEILGIIGPNGAGKTTLFNILSGFLKPDSGRVLFRDKSLARLKPHQICRLGMVCTFQIVRPFLDLTVLDNVAVAALNRCPSMAEAEKKAREVLRFMGLEEKQDALAGELNLPGRKKLELARAVATEPELLLLDEVMAGINPRETDALIELVREIHRRGTTILLIEHVMRGVMALSQKIVVINFGEKIAMGPPQEVIRNRLVVQAYLGEDFNLAEP